MYSNFKYFKASNGEEFYVICDVYSQTELDEFLSTRPKHPVVDIGPTYYHKNWYDRFPIDYDIYRVPKWLAVDADQYLNETFSNTVETRATFNFMLNKSNVHRYILLKLIEGMGFKTDYYTYSGVESFNTQMYSLVNYIEQLQHVPVEIAGHLVQPVNTEPKFHTDETSVVTKAFVTTSGDSSPAYNLSNYQKYLKPNFESTAVSLISESVVTEEQAGDWAIHFSEKTLFSVLGLTFPIWVGGYGQAEAWESLGFDTFSDVINHRYQYMNTLVERCYYALYDNRHLLDDFDYAAKLRKMHRKRLLANREMLLNNHMLHNVNEAVKQLPKGIDKYVQDMRVIWFSKFDSKQ
jgi:hypothetical protein